MPSEDPTDLAAAVERLKHKCCLIDARSDCRFTYVTELAADIRTVLAALRLQDAAPQLLAALRGVLELIAESKGIAGWHLNGEIAAWDEFECIDEAAAAIAAATGEGA